MHICTYNVQTLQEERLDNLLCETDLINWDIIGLCETRLRNEVVISVTGGHTLYHSGVSNDVDVRKYGVGFLVHKKRIEAVIQFHAVSERLAFLKL